MSPNVILVTQILTFSSMFSRVLKEIATVKTRAGGVGTAAVRSNLPVFPVKEDDVQIISDPKGFYSSLTDGILNAKHRITLASLYIGSEEKHLVRSASDRRLNAQCNGVYTNRFL
jgi:CDP-diacylglycerol--glycerol-3-phosphate 3-phosphatidyltransferase